MKLSAQQIKQYQENGFLAIENLFSKEEIQELKDGILKIDPTESPNIVREQDGKIRSIFAPHNFSEAFNSIYQQARIVVPVRQLLKNNEVYLYQYKLNNKKAFTGGAWEWHQDFPFWHIDDGVKNPEMVSVMLLMQDTDYAQGPLMFIPKSHKIGIADFQHKAHLSGKNVPIENSLNGDLKFTIKKELIKKMVDKDGIKGGIGKIGTVLFFHPNVYHASNGNISPYDRNTAIITYNVTSNLPEDKKEKNRPNYICSRDFRPIRPIQK